MSTPDGGLRAPTDGAGRRSDPVSTGSAGPVTRPVWCVLGGVLGAALAAASVAAVFVVDDTRWLRLAVMTALWSALIAVAVVLRRAAADRAADRHDAEALRRRYARELEREVDARREYEAALDAEGRQAVVQEHQQELAALRAEVEYLRARADVASAVEAPPRLRVVGGTSLPVEVPSPDSHPPAAARGGSHRFVEAPPLPTSPTPSAAPARGPSRAAPAAAWSVPPTFGRPTPPNPLPSPLGGAAPRPGHRPGAEPHAPAGSWPPPPGSGEPPAGASLTDGSFVDQYVRSTGYLPPRGSPTGTAPPPPASEQAPPGRTVAELIAAHAAPGSGFGPGSGSDAGPGPDSGSGRRRRDLRA